MIKLSNALIIVGTNRNSGKTSLACELISRCSADHPVTAIKISPHFHPIEPWEKVLIRTDDFAIVEETRNGTGKDSSRMFDAGATRVFYIQAWDDNLKTAFEALLPLLDGTEPIICESGWLRQLVHPGGFIILNRKGNTDMKENIARYRSMAHLWVEFKDPGFDIDLSVIRFSVGSWHLSPDPVGQDAG